MLLRSAPSAPGHRHGKRHFLEVETGLLPREPRGRCRPVLRPERLGSCPPLEVDRKVQRAAARQKDHHDEMAVDPFEVTFLERRRVRGSTEETYREAR